MGEYIGIIIKNQEGNVFIQNNRYYLKVKLDEGKDLELVIRDTIDKFVNQRIYRNIKTYDKVLNHKNIQIRDRYKIIKMYVVEVSVFNNKNFIAKENVITKLEDEIDKQIFEDTIIKYEKYTKLVSQMIFNIIMPCNLLLWINDENKVIFNEFIFAILVILLIASFVGIIFNARIAISLLKYDINEKFIKTQSYIGNIISVLVFIVILAKIF